MQGIYEFYKFDEVATATVKLAEYVSFELEMMNTSDFHVKLENEIFQKV